ncbi:GNAT family N-acetyltransferase [Cytobacillus spongiae]|uniref:GNAT family N-acetyltransferase n=1 Tax=Cytobacillus spongiae TaxID=2901381 RepID=UPI001F439207|nr:GNAT family N-acetyltransferase [Cytobacillus spongiae]UII55876.1 GNAT family N-acetyltransferase [Cytobacillus spongiae]
MAITYIILPEDNISLIKGLCNELMAFQKTKASITPERFDQMSFETRLLPSIRLARDNFVIVAKDEGHVVAYAYSNICDKRVYESGTFGKFFDMDSVAGDTVGCLSQFYIQEGYRGKGIGSVLFNESMKWMNSFEEIEDIFIYVSNGNDEALQFYQSKGFHISHEILDGFITVLRNS